MSWDQIVKSVERQKGERWESFSARYGDWGRDAALWLGRRAGRLRLRELAELAGGIDYAAAGTAVARFGRRMERDASLRQRVKQIQNKLSND